MKVAELGASTRRVLVRPTHCLVGLLTPIMSLLLSSQTPHSQPYISIKFPDVKLLELWHWEDVKNDLVQPPVRFRRVSHGTHGRWSPGLSLVFLATEKLKIHVTDASSFGHF